MGLSLNNVPTSDAYSLIATLGPVPSCTQITFLIANTAVLAQLAGKDRSGTEEPWGDEILIPPSTGTYTNLTGMRFRSAIAGKPAQVVAQLIQPEDAIPAGSNAYTQTLSGSGSVTPGVTSVNVDHNAALVGTEPTLDFVDGNGVVWVVADNAPLSKVTVAAKVATPYGAAFPGAPIDGEEFVYAADIPNNVYWRFKWIAGTVNRWVFIGGPPVRSVVETQETTASTAYVDLATPGPSIVVPISGDYRVHFGAFAYSGAGVTNPNFNTPVVGLSVAGGAPGVSPVAQAQTQYMAAGTNAPQQIGASVMTTYLTTGRAAADALTLKYQSSNFATTVAFSHRWIEVLPVAH